MVTGNRKEQQPELQAALKKVQELTRELEETKQELKMIKAGKSPIGPTGLLEPAHLEEFKIILDNMPIMFTIYDPDTLEFRVNSEFEHVLGWTQQDVTNHNIIELLFSEAADQRNALEYIRTLKPGFRDFKTRTKSGEILDTSWANIRLPDGRQLGIGIDIRERKQFEEKLKASNRELEQFAYIASHDLQEPLRMVASFTELLKRRYAPLFDERGKRYMQRIIEGANQMHNLIQDLLAFSRVGRMDTEPTLVDTGKLVDKVAADLMDSLPASAAVVQHTQLPVIYVNEISMTQVFGNLLSNAFKFHKPGEQARVEISASKKGKSWLFKVKDNGIGIAPGYFAKIFNVFQRLHGRDQYPGTGIGLAICKKIIDNYGGKIWVESAEGKGATFFFTIPG